MDTANHFLKCHGNNILHMCEQAQLIGSYGASKEMPVTIFSTPHFDIWQLIACPLLLQSL